MKRTQGHSTNTAGFSLVELMITVVIMGILASVAGAGYASYVRRARSSEARTQIAAIASRENAYRSEFGVYCGAGRSGVPSTTGVSNSWPASAPGNPDDFSASIPTEWTMLGYRPTGRVRYRYLAVAGAAGATPPHMLWPS